MARRPRLKGPGRKPLIGFVVGKYFELGTDKRPDFNGIDRNIREAIRWSRTLATSGFLTFTPHLNTFHFEMRTRISDDPIENEEFYRAFDRRFLAEAVDYVFATPNWRESSGGRLEIQLACSLGIPVFESVRDLKVWAEGGTDFSTVTYHTISEEAKNFGSVDIPIVVVAGPHYQGDEDTFLEKTVENEVIAERTAIELFNSRIAAFTPQMNWSVRRLGETTVYTDALKTIVGRLADAVFFLPGWEDDALALTISAALSLPRPKPVPIFDNLTELVKWRDKYGIYRTVATTIIDPHD